MCFLRGRSIPVTRRSCAPPSATPRCGLRRSRGIGCTSQGALYGSQRPRASWMRRVRPTAP
eukprot:9538492-Alexandrium_andersonii.AAC.1